MKSCITLLSGMRISSRARPWNLERWGANLGCMRRLLAAVTMAKGGLDFNGPEGVKGKKFLTE